MKKMVNFNLQKASCNGIAREVPIAKNYLPREKNTVGFFLQ